MILWSFGKLSNLRFRKLNVDLTQPFRRYNNLTKLFETKIIIIHTLLFNALRNPLSAI